VTKDFDSIDVVLHWGVEMDIDMSNETHGIWEIFNFDYKVIEGYILNLGQKKKKKKPKEFTLGTENPNTKSNHMKTQKLNMIFFPILFSSVIF
jgi:hypothetical protein